MAQYLTDYLFSANVHACLCNTFIYQVSFLKEFHVFNDKASAINSNGVCSKLAKMIKRSLWPGQRLAVGKCEYKNIIEASLVSVIFPCMLMPVNCLSTSFVLFFFLAREFPACLMKLCWK